MNLIEIITYVSALLIGVVLGLIGGGGSIITVPIFVYILGIEPIISTAYSLFIVGSSSLVGAIRNAQKGMVDFKTGIVFAIPAVIGVYMTRKLIVPNIPEKLFSIGAFNVTRDVSIMIFFAIIMLVAAYHMIKKNKESSKISEKKNINYPFILLEGITVGLITGLVGAGGGFLIIPALVLLAKIPMKKAIATSLAIISVKSLIGFIGDIQNIEIDWNFLLSFTFLSIIGVFIGLYINKLIDSNKLKKGFGWFIFIIGVSIILKELL